MPMLAQFIWQHLSEPLRAIPWADWQGFWLARILDDRFVVVWFLPLLPILLVLRPHRLRVGLVLSGLTFIAYVFGVAYASLWLLICVGLHRLGEWFATACRRDPGRRPVYIAAAAILGGYLGTLLLQQVSLPAGWDAWLYDRAPWVFPLGARSVAWEPAFAIFRTRLEHGPLPLFAAVFYNPHNIGTAYLLCRMLAYFADLRRGTVSPERRSALHFLAYVCYAPALIQGPLERYAVFQDELDRCHERRGWHTVLPAVARIGWGIAKSVIASVYLLPVLWLQLGMGHSNDYYKHPERIASTWLLYGGVFLHIFWLYLEFSGYCDVSAGIARLLGYRQVENFRWPWLATSLRDFWRRWHISLSGILRDYIYIPLGGSRRRMVLNLCLTFAICGAWHPTAVRGACWGVVMGLMVALNHWWSDWMKRLDATPQGWLPMVRRAVLRLQPLPRICAWVLTQHAFLFSILVFAGGTAAIRVPWEIARRLWTWWTAGSGP